MSVRVDFYVLSSDAGGARTRTVCRLTERAFKAGHHVLVLAASHAEAEQLDELLWTFRQDSFVPHQVLGATPPHADPALEATPVWLCPGPVPEAARDVLINLRPEVPEQYTRFARIAEIIEANEAGREAGRERFRYYRAQDCEVHSHNL